MNYFRKIPLAVIPLLLVNTVAFFGQVAFLRDHLNWILPGDILFAVALESIAVYLAYHAHTALVSNDSALRLRLASYAAGITVGAMNYSHYAPDFRPTFTAVAVGLMSASSPFLWGIHSRRVSRNALMDSGLIEPHAVRLGITRVMWHPVKSIKVMRYAAWLGEQSPQEAISAWEATHAPMHVTSEPEPDALPGNADSERTALPSGLDPNASKADAVRYAVRALSAHGSGTALKPADVAAYLSGLGRQCTAQYVRDVQRRDGLAEVASRRGQVHAISRPSAES